MSSSSVSLVLPGAASSATREARRAAIRRYLESSGFEFEILTPETGSYGALLREAVSEARGSVIVVADPDWADLVTTIGDSVAIIQSRQTDIAFAGARGTGSDMTLDLLRKLLVEELPDRRLALMAFSAEAAKLVIGESRLDDRSCILEIAFLANKYGFRIERLSLDPVELTTLRPAFGAWSGLLTALRIRWHERQNAYRAGTRCPVCFSNEVWTRAQLTGKLIRSCSRCKCRFLAQSSDEEAVSDPVRRVLRPHLPPAEAEESHSSTARERTSQRHLNVLRRQLHARARVLEVGVRDASFAAAASREYEYVGIDPFEPAVRAARARDLDVYRATLGSFVNTGPAFDAVTLFHVLENISDPHDALGRLKELLKPGGVLFLTAFDTEGLLYLWTEQRRMDRNFRTHRILYSRSALIELLEHSGFELVSIGPDFEYRDRKFLRHTLWQGRFSSMFQGLLTLLPDPLLVSSGSIRIIARRRSGPPMNLRAIRSVEPTHAR